MKTHRNGRPDLGPPKRSGHPLMFPNRANNFAHMLCTRVHLPLSVQRLIRSPTPAAHPLLAYSGSSALSLQRLIRSPTPAAHPLSDSSGSSALRLQRLIRSPPPPERPGASAAHPLSGSSALIGSGSSAYLSSHISGSPA